MNWNRNSPTVTPAEAEAQKQAALEQARADAKAKELAKREEFERQEAARPLRRNRELAEGDFLKSIADDLARLKRDRYGAIAALDRAKAEELSARIAALESLQTAAQAQLSPKTR
ncbi:MAG: hypothetical protein M0Z91_05840 [Actinomycetota bacterium]|nr:hypothetical protein [Actinomycetota bacterium]